MIDRRRKAAFLDRDGVINHDLSYVGRPEDFILIDGVPEALRLLDDAGFLLVVVTNQSGIGRGYFTEDDYQRVTARMRALLAEHRIALAAVIHCPHAPGDGCDCRKPQPGMLIEGATRVGAALDASVVFGDKASDTAAGRAAGVARCLAIGDVGSAKRFGADDEGEDLLACVRLLLASDIAREDR